MVKLHKFNHTSPEPTPIHSNYMQSTRIAVDALWRCLCPSIDNVVLRRNLSFLPQRTRVPDRSIPTKLCLQTHRTLHNSSRKRSPEAAASSANANINQDFLLDNEAWSTRPRRTQASYTPPALKKSTAATLAKVPPGEIERWLSRLVKEPGKYHECAQCVEYLITERKIEPSAFHYDILIRANADPELGSATVVKNLLREMKEMEILPTLSVYHGALLVYQLAIQFELC